MDKRFVAEFPETHGLVPGRGGSAVLAAAFPGVGSGLLGVNLAFGLPVRTMPPPSAPALALLDRPLVGEAPAGFLFPELED